MCKKIGHMSKECPENTNKGQGNWDGELYAMKPQQNGGHLADDICKCILFYKNILILIQIW